MSAPLRSSSILRKVPSAVMPLVEGKNKLCFRIDTPKFPDSCVQRSDVYICVKNPITSSLKKPF